MLKYAMSVFLVLAFSSLAKADDKLKVLTSFSILADMVQEVAGDKAEVKTLVGPNGDAHVYEPTPADAKALAGANIIFVNGLGFEGWLERLIGASGFKGVVVVTTDGIKPLELLDEKSVADPHAWQSLENAPIYVGNILKGLVKADPAHADFYRANAARYLKELAGLNIWVKNEIGAVPAAKRKVITSHDAFQYFSRAYGVEFLAPQGLSTEAQPSAGDVARLVDQIRAQKVRALFIENITDPRMIEQLRSDGNAVIGGTLYSDALSEPSGPAPTYEMMFKHNISVLVPAMKQNAQ